MDSSAVLRKALVGDKATVQAPLQAHLAEMRAFGFVAEPYPHFDLYWSEATRWPI